jgi:hypothetical protein
MAEHQGAVSEADRNQSLSMTGKWFATFRKQSYSD